MRSRKEMALFVRTTIDRVVDQIRTYAAIIEQRVSFGWRSVTDNGFPILLRGDQET